MVIWVTESDRAKGLFPIGTLPLCNENKYIKKYSFLCLIGCFMVWSYVLFYMYSLDRVIFMFYRIVSYTCIFFLNNIAVVKILKLTPLIRRFLYKYQHVNYSKIKVLSGAS